MPGAPFVRRAYPGPQNSRVSDLIVRAGEAASQDAMTRGQRSADRYQADSNRSAWTATSIASMISNSANQWAQYAQQAPQRELVQLNVDQAKAQAATSKLVTGALDQAGGDLVKAIVALEGQGHGSAATVLRDKRRQQQVEETQAAVGQYALREKQFSEGNRLVAAALADPAQYPKLAPRLKGLAESIEQGWGDLVPDHYDPKALQAFDAFTLTEAERAARQKSALDEAEKKRQGVKSQTELDDWGRDALAVNFSLLDPAQVKPEEVAGALMYAKNRGVSNQVLSMFGASFDESGGLMVQDPKVALAAAAKLRAAKPSAVEAGSLPDLIETEEKKLGRPLTNAEKLGLQRKLTNAKDTTPNVSAGDTAASQLTPEALDMAAHQFAVTGAMPTLGMGKTAADARAKIINRAAAMYSGLDLPTQMAAYASAKESLKKRGEQLSSLSAFEETAMKNLERFLELAEKIPDSGVPLLNRPLRTIDAELLGSPDMAAFNTARRAVIPEFARILTNPNLTGVLSDSARHEVETLLASDYTLAQIKASARELVIDAKNRKTSLQDEIGALQRRIASPPQVRAAAPEAPVPDAVGDVLVGQPDGEYELSDGSVWVIKNGTLSRKGGA